jgi:hypothetical protein
LGFLSHWAAAGPGLSRESKPNASESVREISLFI